MLDLIPSREYRQRWRQTFILGRTKHACRGCKLVRGMHRYDWDELFTTPTVVVETFYAVMAFRQASTVAPTDHRAHFYLGVVLIEQGKLEEALQAFKQVGYTMAGGQDV